MRDRATLVCLFIVLGGISLCREAPTVQAQAACAVTGERQMLVLEPRPVQWGGEVDVTVLLDVACDPSARTELRITEKIPPSLRYQPDLGTIPSTVNAEGLRWNIPEPTGRITITYRVYVTPEPVALEPTGRLEITWPMVLELTVDGHLEVPKAPAVDPLVVARRPGARSCNLDASVDIQPPEVAAGEPFVATIGFRFDRCRFPGPRQRAALAVQPTGLAQDLAGQVAALKAFGMQIAAYQTGQPGMVGGSTDAPGRGSPTPPTEDIARLAAWLDGLDAGDARSLDLALDGAVAMLEDWPSHHEVVYAVTQSGAPPVDATAWRQSVDAARSRGIEVVVVCVGTCDTALAPDLTVPAWSSLKHWSEALVAAHLGPEAPVGPVTISAETQDYLRLLPGSAKPPAEVADGTLAWRDLSVAPGATLRVSFRGAIDRWGRFPVGASGLATIPGPEGREPVTTLLLPGFVTVRRPLDDGQSCRADVDKTAAPERLPLGDLTTVTLSLRPECQELEHQTRIVLSLDRSGSMGRGVDFTYVKLAARALADLLAVETTAERRFGLVSHGDPPEVAVPLTNDPDDIQRRIDALAARGQDNLAQSIVQATEMLVAARAGPNDPVDEFLVVLSDGGQTYPPASALPAAEAARAAGITVVSVCARTASSDCATVARLASSPDHVFEVDRVDRALERFVELGLQLRQVRVSEAEITDDLPPYVQLVPDTAQPEPDRVEGGRMVWHLDDPSPLGTSIRYQVRPLRLGRQALNVWADARFADVRGRSGHAVFPVPEVETFSEPDLGPCRVQLATLADDGAVMVGDPITLSLEARVDCPPRPVPLDTVLAIDHSSSMGTFSRLENARAAAHAFLDALDPSQAWAGLVAFSGAVTESVPLTGDFAAVRAAVDRLVPNGQTSLATAIREAHSLFDLRRPDTNAAIVLLTDGRTQGAIESVLAAADAAKADDILIVTFCAGNCDPELSRVASRPELAVTVADSAELVALYRDLAVELANDTARGLTVEQWLPDGLAVVPGSAHPTPDEGPTEGRSSWRFDRAPSDGVTVSLHVDPLRSGVMSLGQAWLTYRYGPSGYGRVRFPERIVTVASDPPNTATPFITPVPTATRPADPATATPGPGRLYLPAACGACVTIAP